MSYSSADKSLAGNYWKRNWVLFIKHCGLHLRRHPTDALGWIKLGMAHCKLNQNRKQLALRCLERGREVAGDNVYFELQYATARYSVGDTEESKRLFLQIIQRNPDFSAAYWTYANALSWSGADLSEVLSMCRRAIKADPADPYAFYHYGRHLSLVDEKRAMKYIKKAAKLGHEDAIKIVEDLEKERD